MLNDFIAEFFDFPIPIPHKTLYTEEEVKKDLKLILEIATSTQLARKTEKDGRIVYSCKQHGRACFSISVVRLSTLDLQLRSEKPTHPLYMVEDDFLSKNHQNSCEKGGEEALYFKTYCLLQLKKPQIERFMIENRLMNSEPSEILIKYSRSHSDDNRGEKYFFDKYIKNLESRKSLKKKFDNIVNIDIKANYKQKEKGKGKGFIIPKKDPEFKRKIASKVSMQAENCGRRPLQCSENSKLTPLENSMKNYYSSLLQETNRSNPRYNAEVFIEVASQYAKMPIQEFCGIDYEGVLKETVNENWFEDNNSEFRKQKAQEGHGGSGTDKEDTSNVFGLSFSKEHFDFEENK